MKRNSDRRVILNVGGVRHEVMWKTLEKLPNSRLGKIRYAKSLDDIRKLCDDFDPIENELFFDRHSNSFSTVLNFYRTGKLHYPRNECLCSFGDELAFFNISDETMGNCCHEEYFNKVKETQEETAEDVVVNKNEKEEPMSFRERMWDAFENPQKDTIN